MTTDARTDRIDPVTSERLSVARVLCILGMIWVHVPGAATDGVGRALEASDPAGTLQAFLVEAMGRSSAALLSVVSGWLCARTLLGGRGPHALIRARARTVLAPMLFWSLATVAVYALVSLARPTFLTVSGPIDAQAVRLWIDSVLFLSSAPSGPTMHLAFLRDLFVCACLAPALLWALRRQPAALLVGLGALYLGDLESVVVLRPLVLFAFAVGMWLALARVPTDAADRYLGLWVALTCVAALAVMLANGGAFGALEERLDPLGIDLRESVLYPVSRLFGSLAAWTLTARLAGSATGRALAAQMPWLFTTYCSHFLVLGVLWAGLLEPLGLRAASPAFTAWFLLAPLVALLVGRAIVRLVLAWWPSGAAALGLRSSRRRGGPGPGPGPGLGPDPNRRGHDATRTSAVLGRDGEPTPAHAPR